MAAKNVLDPVYDRFNRTANSAREPADNARGVYEEGRRAIPEIARTAQRVFSEVLDHLRSQGHDAADEASDRIDDARHYVVEQVQDRPFAATLAVLGAGFVLGLLFARRRR